MGFLFALYLILNIAFAEDCPGGKPVGPKDLTPEGMKVWALVNPGVNSVEKAICCLPKIYRDNFLIAHSSIAAQNGTPDCVRVLMHPSVSQQDLDKDVMVFSANCGAEGMNQKNNLEMVFYRKSNEKLEFADADYGKQFVHVSGKNPKACMECHGEFGKEPPEGPRPIFDPFGHWPRFVGGPSSCNPVEDKLQIEKQQRAIESVIANPRFRCLNQDTLKSILEKIKSGEKNLNVFTSAGRGLVPFDSFFFDINSKRVVRMIRKTPHFDKYKFLLVGQDYCDALKVEEWMPKHVIEQHNNLSSVAPDVAHIRTRKDLENVISKRKEQAAARIRFTGQQMNDPVKSKSMPLDPSTSVFACEKDENKDAALNLPESAFRIENPVLRAYYIEQTLNQMPLQIRGNLGSYLRFLFDGRGISTEFWSVDDAPGDRRAGVDIAGAIESAERKGSELDKIMRPWQELPAFPAEGEREKAMAKVCAGLKRASMEALSKIPPSSGGKDPATTSR